MGCAFILSIVSGPLVQFWVFSGRLCPQLPPLKNKHPNKKNSVREKPNRLLLYNSGNLFEEFGLSPRAPVEEAWSRATLAAQLSLECLRFRV